MAETLAGEQFDSWLESRQAAEVRRFDPFDLVNQGLERMLNRHGVSTPDLTEGREAEIKACSFFRSAASAGEWTERFDLNEVGSLLLTLHGDQAQNIHFYVAHINPKHKPALDTPEMRENVDPYHNLVISFDGGDTSRVECKTWSEVGTIQLRADHLKPNSDKTKVDQYEEVLRAYPVIAADLSFHLAQFAIMQVLGATFDEEPKYPPF